MCGSTWAAQDTDASVGDIIPDGFRLAAETVDGDSLFLGDWGFSLFATDVPVSTFSVEYLTPLTAFYDGSQASVSTVLPGSNAGPYVFPSGSGYPSYSTPTAQFGNASVWAICNSWYSSSSSSVLLIFNQLSGEQLSSLYLDGSVFAQLNNSIFTLQASNSFSSVVPSGVTLQGSIVGLSGLNYTSLYSFDMGRTADSYQIAFSYYFNSVSVDIPASSSFDRYGILLNWNGLPTSSGQYKWQMIVQRGSADSYAVYSCQYGPGYRLTGQSVSGTIPDTIDSIYLLLQQILSAIQSSGESGSNAVVTAVNNASTTISNSVQNVTNTITNIFQSTQEQVDAAKEVTDQISDKAADIKDASEQIAAGTPKPDASELAQANNPIEWIQRTDPAYTSGVDSFQQILSDQLFLTMLMLVAGFALCAYVLYGKRV